MAEQQAERQSFTDDYAATRFAASNQAAVAYAEYFGWSDPALEAFESSIAQDGWVVADTLEDWPSGEEGKLRPSGNHKRQLLVRETAVAYRQLFEAGLASADVEPIPVNDLNALAVDHDILTSIGAFLPAALAGPRPSQTEVVKQIDRFYTYARQALPEETRGQEEADHANSIVLRFSQGFAATILTATFNRLIGRESATAAMAAIITRARVHPNPMVRSLGDPMRPGLVTALIGVHSDEYNQAMSR